ncbi:unnamed protein product [Pleuronectes platessa]|uniref:Uncharacterized protein n=1 Tax=Pleuronectes platessa TaxID=8262 RepID=A0A9N7ZD77_PLEPL|nr:unnamed protein product [Pleuronectes platessa]
MTLSSSSRTAQSGCEGPWGASLSVPAAARHAGVIRVGSWRRRRQHLPARSRAKESERLLFVSPVSKPPTIFFLLINLVMPPYCRHLWGGGNAGAGCEVGKEGQMTTEDWSSEAGRFIFHTTYLF